MSLKFTADQVKAINGICKTLLNAKPNSHAIAVLTGPAGTGKTTIVKEIIDRIEQTSMVTHIELCATTHRAAQVLKNIVGRPVYTGHALFKLRPTVTKNGKESLKKVGICDVALNSIVIIDEASMIGNKFLEAIVDVVKERNLKLLFVGDPFQLPPPTDRCCIFDGSLATFPLETVHRQALGNPILAKATEYREFMQGGAEPILETSLTKEGKGIHILPHKEFVSRFVKKYMGYKTGAEVDIPMCTYTNASAINYNSMIRKAAYFLEGTIAPFYTGERLIANSVVMEGERTVLTNNEIVHVMNYEETEQFDIPGYLVTLKGEFNRYTKTDIKYVFSPKSKAIADKKLLEYKNLAIHSSSSAEWTNYYSIKNTLADLRPPFAGTTHKAQGGTFPAVFIDRTNINKCRNPSIRARLFYVALTRASDNVYINS